MTKETQNSLQTGFKPPHPVAIGGKVLQNEPITYNENRHTVQLKVRNTGDRPIQVGSHFHFFEVNRYLEFDRIKAYGCHLNIPATTAIRFEPGDEKEVELVAYSGKQYVMGFNNLVNGYTGGENIPSFFPQHILAMERVTKFGFKNKIEDSSKNSNE